MTSDAEGDSPVERTYWAVSNIACEIVQRQTLRKNSLNASLPTICALAFNPDSRRVSCRNFAMSRRTRRSFRCFSCYTKISALRLTSQAQTYCGKLVLERRGKHIGEQLKCHGNEEFHERDNDKDRERDEAQ